MIGIPPFPAHEKTALCLDRAVNSVGWQSIFSCFYMYPFVNRRKRSLISTGIENIDRYKIVISYLTAEHAGQPDKNGQYRILSTMEKQPPKVVCSETYLVAGAFDTEAEADNYMRYLKTRFVRFLISILAMTQHISKGMFGFVPVQDFSRAWTDEELFSKYKLTSDEVAFIQSIIKEMA